MTADPMPWVPPLLQRRVVSYLDQYVEDAKRRTEALTASVALLEELRRSLITASVTGQFDVSSADGSGIAV
jgi:type I restriction enzyme S subunit